jgi:hypothetical protein
MPRARFSLLLLLVGLAALRADDLVTRDGQVYKDYRVLSHDTGFITIMYVDGGGKIPLSQLPADLQRKYGYDPAAAAAAVQAATAQDRKDRQAMAAEAARQQAAAAEAAQARARSQAQALTQKPLAPPAAVASAPRPPGGVSSSLVPNDDPHPDMSSVEAAPPVSPSADDIPWDQLERICKHLATLQTKLAQLSHTNGSSSAGVSELQNEIDDISNRLSTNEQLLAVHKAAGPRLSPVQMSGLRLEAAETEGDQARAQRDKINDYGPTAAKYNEATQELYFLQLELKYAND